MFNFYNPRRGRRSAVSEMSPNDCMRVIEFARVLLIVSVGTRLTRFICAGFNLKLSGDSPSNFSKGKRGISTLQEWMGRARGSICDTDGVAATPCELIPPKFGKLALDT